jgi:hypothetical protein
VILAPGVYPAMPFDEYFSFENISKHQLDSLARSPAHYRAALEHPRKRTPAMAFGAAVHAAVLEPEDFCSRYWQAPDTDKRTKAGKQAYEAAEAAGHILLKEEEWIAILAMTDAIRAHPYASILLAPEDGESEISLSWIDEETGVHCKARPDFVNSAHDLIVDLKTSENASMGAFARACVNYRYHVQAGFYLAAAPAAGVRANAFVFVVAETECPWAIGIYELAPDDLELGRTLYRKDLRLYAQCLASDTWPSYPPEVRQLELPQWARFVPVS